MSHTPGPWTVVIDPDYADRYWLQGVQFGAEWETSGEIEANARLMSACPELLNTLKRILDGFEAGIFVRDITRDSEPDWAIKLLPFLKLLGEAQAAIAKAEGR